jgi:hypothetical protein
MGNNKIAVFRETHPEDKISEGSQDHIHQVLGMGVL